MSQRPRQVSSGTQYYEVPADVPEQRRSRRVPWLQMRGDWLAACLPCLPARSAQAGRHRQAAGFDIQAPVRVRVMRGCLVLTVEES